MVQFFGRMEDAVTQQISRPKTKLGLSGYCVMNFLARNGNTVTVEVEGRQVRTLRDLLPEKPGLQMLLVAKTPAPVSVEAGHYFQGTHGRMFWNRLIEYGVLKPTTPFEDDSLLLHGYGITDIVKVPRNYGNEPTDSEYLSGIERILGLVRLHKPAVVLFVYKGVLDKVLKFQFNVRAKACYGFNPGFDSYLGTRVFAFPMPGTPCKAQTAARAMQELSSVLGSLGVEAQQAVAPDPAQQAAEQQRR